VNYADMSTKPVPRPAKKEWTEQERAQARAATSSTVTLMAGCLAFVGWLFIGPLEPGPAFVRTLGWAAPAALVLGAVGALLFVRGGARSRLSTGILVALPAAAVVLALAPAANRWLDFQPATEQVADVVDLKVTTGKGSSSFAVVEPWRPEGPTDIRLNDALRAGYDQLRAEATPERPVRLRLTLGPGLMGWEYIREIRFVPPEER